MDKSQQKKAYKTASQMMRLSAEHTGTIEELMLIEAARFLLRQTDEIIKLQRERDELYVQNARLVHRRARSLDEDFEYFGWAESDLGL